MMWTFKQVDARISVCLQTRAKQVGGTTGDFAIARTP